jgi:hypothetical protein
MTNRFIVPGPLAILLAIPMWRSAAAQQPSPIRVCIAPTTVEAVTGNALDAANAVREAFASYLTGPTLTTEPLQSRLQSQAREEARGAHCPYVLLTTINHVHKTSMSNGLLGRMAGSAVQAGASAVGSSMGSTVGRVAASATASAAGIAAYNYSSSVKTKDELSLVTRLESASGEVLAERTDKRKAQSDGEDLITPAVAKAAEAIAAAVRPKQ